MIGSTLIIFATIYDTIQKDYLECIYLECIYLVIINIIKIILYMDPHIYYINYGYLFG